MWNYLRVRGEYEHARIPRCYQGELPPRARRIRALNHSNFLCHGTTSACAENTAVCGGGDGRLGNYLRVRGEYVVICFTSGPGKELPPRARRIRPQESPIICFLGTTSACAENTGCGEESGVGAWNYLRVRGEYDSCHDSSFLKMELPPRARRILGDPRDMPGPDGTTSAYAENTDVPDINC